MKFREIKIGELAHSEPGSFKIGPFGSSLKKDEIVKEGIPVLGIENVLNNIFTPPFRKNIKKDKYKQLCQYVVKPGDILVTTMGTIGYAAVVPDNMSTAIIDSHLFRMRINQLKAYPHYLCYGINYHDGVKRHLQQMSRGAIMEGLNTTILKECALPLPPLAEQKRIATILEKADRLRRLRRYALELSGTYLQAVFMEMFSKNADALWPNENIESLLQEKKGAIRTGPFGSQLLHSEFVKEGIAVLGIDNAVQNRFEWAVRRFITEEKYQELKRYKVFPGDVIITIMGTPGRCAVIPENIPLSINTKHLCCITLDQNRCLPTYLKFCFLTHPSVLRQLNVSEHGAVMPGLNMEIIKELIVPCPPLALQQKFTEIVQKFERLLAQQREAERQAEHLFQTLLHKAFQGELSMDEDEVLMPDVEIAHQRMPVFADVIEPLDTDVFQMALPME